MSSDNQKRFDRFIWLDPPKFNNVIGEDTYEFFLNSYERMHNLESLDSHGGAYIIYQLNDLWSFGAAFSLDFTKWVWVSEFYILSVNSIKSIPISTLISLKLKFNSMILRLFRLFWALNQNPFLPNI